MGNFRPGSHKRRLARLVGAALLALSPLADANVVGVDTQNFNPTNDGLDFVTVHSSETLTPGVINFGLFLNYAVNSLPNYENRTTQSRTNFSDSLLSADLNLGVGLMRNWEVGASFPVLLQQSVESDQNTFRGEFATNGLTEIRLMTKYRVYGDHDHGVAAVFSTNFSQIENNPFTGTEPGPTYNFELAGDMTFGKFAVGLNGGYRLRNPGEPISGIPVAPMGDQYIGSMALSYLFSEADTKIIAEVFGSAPAEETQFVSDRDDSSAEFLLGLKTDITPSLAFHFGGGTEIIHGTSSPDWRVYSGINYVIGPLFSKQKDVFVKVDEQPLRNLEDLDTADPFEGEPASKEAFIARDLLFEFNSDRLHPDALDSLRKLVDYVKRPPGLQSMIIEGHTDSIGSAVYNANLSQRRASRVKQELVKMGLPANRIRAIGYGESKPIADNGNYQGRAMNRRVEFKITR